MLKVIYRSDANRPTVTFEAIGHGGVFNYNGELWFKGVYKHSPGEVHEAICITTTDPPCQPKLQDVVDKVKATLYVDLPYGM